MHLYSENIFPGYQCPYFVKDFIKKQEIPKCNGRIRVESRSEPCVGLMTSSDIDILLGSTNDK